MTQRLYANVYVLKLLRSVTFSVMCRLRYATFTIWNSYALKLLHYETLTLWNSYIMKLLHYETLTLWNSYIMKLLRYETLKLCNSYVKWCFVKWRLRCVILRFLTVLYGDKCLCPLLSCWKLREPTSAVQNPIYRVLSYISISNITPRIHEFMKSCIQHT